MNPAPICACQASQLPTVAAVEKPSFISVRSALVVLFALVLGLAFGPLAFIAYGNVAGAVIAGSTTFGVVLGGAHALIAVSG